MTQRDKLVARVRARPPKNRFSDVRAALEGFGLALDREKGSHVVFDKAGELPIVVAKDGGRWVRRVYLDDICDRLGLDD